MPFKTKKHKIAAKKHRVTITESGKISWSSSASEIRIGGGKNAASLDENDLLSGVEVKKELLRISTLAGIIIGLQLALRILNLPFVS